MSAPVGAVGQAVPQHRIPQTVDELPGKRPQHPLYKTASQEYGKGVTEAAVPISSGRKGCFTKEFVGGPVRDCGLNVSVDKSRVAKNPGPLGTGPSNLL